MAKHLTTTVLRTLTEQPQSLVDISKAVFNRSGYSPDMDEFYTYQYDMRWSLHYLVKEGVAQRTKSGLLSYYSLATD